MINIKLKPCCYDCSSSDLYTNEELFLSDDKVYGRHTIVGCKHEKVCKAYLESKEKNDG